jgi:DnaJ-class molecular chaperone
MTIPPGTQSGQKFRLAGKGVPAHRGRPAGDEIVIVQMTVPEKIDEESKRLIREFAERNPANPREKLR